MLTNKLIILNLFSVVSLFYIFGCHSNIEFKDDKKLLKNITNEVLIKDSDSLIEVNVSIYNGNKESILISNWIWILDGRSSEKDFSLTYPTNPGIKNTIHYYPYKSNIGEALLDIGWSAENDFIPKFIAVEGFSKKFIKILISKNKTTQKDKLTKYPRFFKGTKYTFNIKLSVISLENFEKIFGDIKKQNAEIYSNNNIFIDLSLNVSTWNYLTTTVETTKNILNQQQSEQLNELGSNKLNIYFDYDFK